MQVYEEMVWDLFCRGVITFSDVLWYLGDALAGDYL